MSDCNGKRGFTVRADGRYESGYGMKGQLPPEKLEILSEIAKAMIAENLILAPLCETAEFGQDDSAYRIEIATSADSVSDPAHVVYEDQLRSRRTCTLGDRTKATDLRDIMTELAEAFDRQR